MDSLLESASTYVEVLRNCSSAKVADWKQKDLERAVNWAEYFKRVNARLLKKPALVRKFDMQLKEISLQTGRRFERQTLSAEFLGSSLDYLITSLLENPDLPEGIKELVHKKYATEDQLKHVEKCGSTEALFSTLTAIHSKLACSAPPFLKRDPLLVASAVVLKEELQWVLSSHTQTPTIRIQEKLNDLVRQENGLEVILFSIVSQIHLTFSQLVAPSSTPTSEALPSACSNSVSEVNTTQAILEWLEQCLQAKAATHPSDLPHQSSEECSDIVRKKFWALSPELLASIAAQSVDFFHLFYKMLAGRVNQIESELLERFEKDRDCGGDYVVRLETEALCYFRALINIDERVREVTVALVDRQVQETATRILAVSKASCFPQDSSTSDNTSAAASQSFAKLPVNLWRQVLAIVDLST